MIFIDTSFIYAFSDPDDLHHQEAVMLLKHALRSGEVLTLHNYIVVEGLALFDRRLGRNAARELIETVKKFTVQWIEAEEHIAAEAEFSEQKSARVSFVDTVSFIFMRSRGIKRYLAFDSDFDRSGFKMFDLKTN